MRSAAPSTEQMASKLHTVQASMVSIAGLQKYILQKYCKYLQQMTIFVHEYILCHSFRLRIKVL